MEERLTRERMFYLSKPAFTATTHGTTLTEEEGANRAILRRARGGVLVLERGLHYSVTFGNPRARGDHKRKRLAAVQDARKRPANPVGAGCSGRSQGHHE